MNLVDAVKWSDIDLGEAARQLPNTYKGQAFKSVWIPGGFNGLDEPFYRVHSISGTTTRANNLRGINVPVTLNATTFTVTFPSQQPGVLPNTPQTFVGPGSPTTGTMVPGTYYYRLAPRTRWIGPRTWANQVTRVLLAGPPPQTQAQIRFTNLADHTNDILIEGWTVLRGQVSGGPYTHRVDMVPIEQVWGHLASGVSFLDNGPTVDWTQMGNSSFTGYAPSQPWIAGSYTPVDESGWEPDTAYAVKVTPSWPTTVGVGTKTVAGFTMTFDTQAPVGATIDWFLVR